MHCLKPVELRLLCVIKMANVKQYYHTIKYLKLSQLSWRIWYALCRPAYPKNTSVKQRIAVSPWVSSIVKETPFSKDGITLLNTLEQRPLSELWQTQDQPLLWLYQLHYFDYIDYCEESLLLNWIAKNPYGKGVGWAPYPTSLRLVNWIRSVDLQDFKNPVIIESLFRQAQYLSRRIEYHILGNHLLANAKALLFAGLFFEGAEADTWLKKAMAIFEKELAEQILDDGAHFELSPMYHAIVLNDCLDILNVIQVYQDKRTFLLQKRLITFLPAMFSWLENVSHPDGEISFFNDATLGVAPTFSLLSDYASRLFLDKRIKVRSTHESGYYRLTKGKAVVIADVAAIGPSYQPGHAHADTLSFEMSLDKQRIFVNSGINCYGVSQARVHQRGTAAHNTAVIDGENSSAVWSGFRVGQRAIITAVHFDEHCHAVTLDAEMQYQQKTHLRAWNLNANMLSITDIITAAGEHKVDLYFHCHPDVRLLTFENEIRLLFNEKEITSFSTSGNCVVKASSYYPGFNCTIPNQCIRVTQFMQDRCKISTEIRWENVE